MSKPNQPMPLILIITTPPSTGTATITPPTADHHKRRLLLLLLLLFLFFLPLITKPPPSTPSTSAIPTLPLRIITIPHSTTTIVVITTPLTRFSLFRPLYHLYFKNHYTYFIGVADWIVTVGRSACLTRIRRTWEGEWLTSVEAFLLLFWPAVNVYIIWHVIVEGNILLPTTLFFRLFLGLCCRLYLLHTLPLPLILLPHTAVYHYYTTTATALSFLSPQVVKTTTLITLTSLTEPIKLAHTER